MTRDSLPVHGRHAAAALPTGEEETRQLARTREQLLREFDDRLPAVEVERRFTDVVARFGEAKVRTFVPLLVAKLVRDELSSAR